jgi:phosphatidylinositol 3-kinase
LSSINLDDSRHSSPASAEAIDSIDAPAHRRSWCKYQAIRGLSRKSNGSIVDNPIQDFLRSAAFDENAPYYVKKDVMDTYVKSCAGYCVVTYLLVRMNALRICHLISFCTINHPSCNDFGRHQGVGDRHLDNILLHQNGHLLHCDFSFILGHDPKTYLPMR